MSGHDTVNPVAILRDIEERCHDSVDNLPRQEHSGDEWSGVAFRIGDSHLVTRLGEVVEILELPELSRVPLTRRWVLGVANMRGNLLPVIDVRGMLSGTLTRCTSRTRVLVVDDEGLYSGLVVDEVFGLKHFSENDFVAEPAVAEDYLLPFSEHGFRVGERVWSVFSLFALAEAPQFLQAAV